MVYGMILDLLKQNFTLIHATLVVSLFVLGYRYITARNTKSNFRVREYDKNSKSRTLESAIPRSDEREEPRAQARPKSLPPHFSNAKAPHEVLGIHPNSSQRQIQKAYRNLMKRYHPDKLVGLSPDQIQANEKIAMQINMAKDQMMKRFE